MTEPGWHTRDGAHLVYFNGKLRIYGGWYFEPVVEWDDGYTTNEEWSSSDGGATWSNDYAHNSSPGTSHWASAHTMGWAETGGYLYCVGGDVYDVRSDTWRTPDGTTWTRMSSSAGWDGRVLQMVGSLGDDLYLCGGQTDLADPTTARNDVWKSSDNGVTWTQISANGAGGMWAKRAATYGLVTFNGYLWLVGGGTYDTDASPGRTYYNDVWKFDGTTWTEVLANGHGQFPGREYHNVVVHKNKLWVSAGYNEGNLNDVYYSSDGVTWTQLTNVTPWAISHADGLCSSPYGLVHATGNALDKKVYILKP